MGSIIRLANDLYNSEKSDQAIYILNDFRSTFPFNSTTVSSNTLFYFVDLYFKADLPAKSELIIDTHFK
jgi:hypothetical protein